jgi:NifU-like protein involved in Fe-S cluster formation
VRYNELTQRYFESAPYAGTLARAARGAAGSIAEGTWVQFDVQTDSAGITDVRFLAFACPHTIAVAAWVAEHSVGRPLQRELPLSMSALREQFALPVQKLGRLLIIEDAWKAAAGVAIDLSRRAPTI